MISLKEEIEDIFFQNNLNYHVTYVPEDIIICVENKVVFYFPVWDYGWEDMLVYKINNENVNCMIDYYLNIFIGESCAVDGNTEKGKQIYKNKEFVYKVDSNNKINLEVELEKVKNILRSCNIKV